MDDHIREMRLKCEHAFVYIIQQRTIIIIINLAE